jgi:1-acyl-sn-glycerol-3-phosphate acyltransferase
MRIVSLFLFVLVTIVLSIISIPVAALDRSGKGYLFLARLWSRIFLFLYRGKLTVLGTENIQKGKPYVFCANHSSYTDIPVLFAGIPIDVRLILRRSLTRIPIWGWALLVSPMIIIDRSNPTKAKRTLQDAAKIIHDGASVLLFPEGTRTHDGNIQPFKRGAFQMAYKSGAEVVPVAINGTFEFLSRTDKLPIMDSNIVITIGMPLHIDRSLPTDRDREADLMRRTEEAVRMMQMPNH